MFPEYLIADTIAVVAYLMAIGFDPSNLRNVGTTLRQLVRDFIAQCDRDAGWIHNAVDVIKSNTKAKIAEEAAAALQETIEKLAARNAPIGCDKIMKMLLLMQKAKRKKSAKQLAEQFLKLVKRCGGEHQFTDLLVVILLGLLPAVGPAHYLQLVELVLNVLLNDDENVAKSTDGEQMLPFLSAKVVSSLLREDNQYAELLFGQQFVISSLGDNAVCFKMYKRKTNSAWRTKIMARVRMAASGLRLLAERQPIVVYKPVFNSEEQKNIPKCLKPLIDSAAMSANSLKKLVEMVKTGPKFAIRAVGSNYGLIGLFKNRKGKLRTTAYGGTKLGKAPEPISFSMLIDTLQMDNLLKLVIKGKLQAHTDDKVLPLYGAGGYLGKHYLVLGWPIFQSAKAVLELSVGEDAGCVKISIDGKWVAMVGQALVLSNKPSDAQLFCVECLNDNGNIVASSTSSSSTSSSSTACSSSTSKRTFLSHFSSSRHRKKKRRNKPRTDDNSDSEDDDDSF